MVIPYPSHELKGARLTFAMDLRVKKRAISASTFSAEDLLGWDLDIWASCSDRTGTFGQTNLQIILYKN